MSDFWFLSIESLGPLDEIPVAVKHMFAIRGRTTGFGSLSRKNAIPKSETATAVERLLASGVVLLGRTQMVEFAFGGWGTNALMGTSRNPWDMAVERVPGGSSSGSAVAVAAGLISLHGCEALAHPG